MTLVRSEHSKMVGVLLELEMVGEPCVLGHKYLYIVQYLSIITFRRDVPQVGYSPLSLYYILLIIGCAVNLHTYKGVHIMLNLVNNRSCY